MLSKTQFFSRIEFCYLILVEPFGYYFNRFFKREKTTEIKKRLPIKDTHVEVCVHEWGGYPLTRTKVFGSKIVVCGLMGQLQRFEQYRQCGKVRLTISLSDERRYQHRDFVSEHCDKLIAIDSNIGMDFGGYSAFYSMIKTKENCYVLLTNTSVDSSQCDFLDGYIHYMEKNLDVGMLGISFSTRMYHTLIRRNFIPHLQSFFILTTLDVLKEVIRLNNGIFPGADADYKRLIIRKGEIPLSRLTLSLGYNLAVVHPDTGRPFKFTDKKNWPAKFDDLRYHCCNPNKITPIVEHS